MRKYILLLLFTVTFLQLSAQPDTADWKPIRYNRWQNKTNPSKYVQTIGLPIQNYNLNNGNWETINNDWINLSDTVYRMQKAALQANVYPNGETEIQIQINNEILLVQQQLTRLIWLNITDNSWGDIFTTPQWGNLSVDSNIIHWDNVFPDVDLDIIKTNGSIAHRINFKPSLLDSLVRFYNQSEDSSSLYIANLFTYSLSGNIINADAELGNTSRRILHKAGSKIFQIERQQLFYPGWDSLPPVSVLQRWIKKNENLYCIEAVPMSTVKRIHTLYPDSILSHNASQTFSDSYIEDTEIFSGGIADWNYGEHAPDLLLYRSGYGANLLRFDLSGITGSVTVDSTELFLRFLALDSGKVAIATTDWIEGNLIGALVDDPGEYGATWNKANDSIGSSADLSWSNDTNFTAADFDDNSGAPDGYGKVDDSATTYSYLRVGQEATGNNSQIVSDWINGVTNNYGYVIIDYDGGASAYRPSEFPASAYRPYLYVEWSANENTKPLRRRRVLMKGKIR